MFQWDKRIKVVLSKIYIKKIQFIIIVFLEHVDLKFEAYMIQVDVNWAITHDDIDFYIVKFWKVLFELF